jgi:periplasmic copper chaperone A
MTRMLMLAATLCFVAAVGAVAGTGTIEIVHPWARASIGRIGVVYMTIKNTGTTDDRLVAAATPLAAQAQLHISVNNNGVMSMRPLSAVDVKANGEAVLHPDGMHLMLIGLKHPLKAGQSFPLTLTFEKAGSLEVTVPVMKVGTTGGTNGMGGMKM